MLAAHERKPKQELERLRVMLEDKGPRQVQASCDGERSGALPGGATWVSRASNPRRGAK